MGYASQSGRARTSASNPQAHAICDRCGFRYNFVDLMWQFEWRGATLQNIKILVCRDCLDTPQENIRSIVIPADPTPIVNARVQDFVAASTDYLTSGPATINPTTGIPVPSTVTVVAQDGTNITSQPTLAGVGKDGLDQNAVMPMQNAISYGVLLPVLSIVSNNSTVITVTCSAVHNLQTGDQISAAGLFDKAAEGFYTVNVVSATVFTYAVYSPVQIGYLLASNSRIVTVNVGLPYTYQQIPIGELNAFSPAVPPSPSELLTESNGYFNLENNSGVLLLG